MIMANITQEPHQHSKLSLPENDFAADRNQTRSSEKIHDMFEFSSPNNYQQNYFTKPTRFAAKAPENIRYLVKQASPSQASPSQASPSHYPMLSKSSSKPSPGKRSVKKSEDWIFQKSKSTSLYNSRSKKHAKGGMEHEYHEEHKVSIFSSPLKSKWLYVLLGLPPKVPPADAVELKTDIKNRQSRHAPSTFFPVNASTTGGGGGCEEVVPEDSPIRSKASEKRKNSVLGSCFGIGGPVQI